MPRKNKLIIRTGTGAPSAADFVTGEPGFDAAAGTLYIKNAAGSMAQITGGGGGGATEIYEYTSASNFPATGSSGALYIDKNRSKLFRWDGVYVELGPVGGGSGGGSSSSIVSAASVSAFPGTGSADIIYIATEARQIYGWDATNSVYVELGPAGGGSGFSWASVPASATASGSAGDLAFDNNYVYVATGSSQWKRAALTTWTLDPLFASTMLLLNMDGTNGSTTITDSSGSPKTITALGNASISTSVKKYGTGSLALDGTGDYLSIPSSADFDLGSYYTIEAWLYPADSALLGSVAHRGIYNAGNQTWTGLVASVRGIGSALRCYFYATSQSNEQYVDVSQSNFPATTWTHFAMVRNGATGKIYANGVEVGTISGLNATSSSSRPLFVGMWDYTINGSDSQQTHWNGYIDDLRITKGTDAASGCRYTTAFTPPSAALPGA